VLLAASLGAVAALSGCGGGFGLANVTQTPQSYTVTVTGTSGTDIQTTTVQLTVE
jgi:ABC-type glycerol-3-phosphate transport system substrate-binding protein